MAPFLHRHRIAVLHYAFWSVYFSFYLYQFGQEYTWKWAVQAIFVTVGCNAAVAYLNYFYLLPRWLHHQNSWRWAAEFAAPFSALVWLRVLAQRHLYATATNYNYLHSATHTLGVALGMLFIVAFVGMLRFAVGWFTLEAKAKTLENEKLTAELRYLKVQLNPHFLFNTLNNLYYLAYTHSPHTPEVVATLAQMMRYMLDEANRPVVALSREIEYLHSYIRLEKLRLNTPIPINLTVTGTTDGIAVSPLIFMAFLENAFKHGVSTTDPNAWVEVHFDLRGKECRFSVANSKLPASQEPTTAMVTGTGLPNVRRRLALSYPDRYELRVQDLPDRYLIDLHLFL
jgi:two-component system sensor histidine kinase AlgZ